MITITHFMRLAAQSLRRGGQRVLVALLCITFGVMSLVAMSMLAKSIGSAIQLTPAQLLGGDLSTGRMAEDTIRPEDVEQLRALQQSGEISRYTLIAFNNLSITFHTPGSGEMRFPGTGMGIEPDNYPLAGSLSIGEPGSIGLPTLLQQAGDVVLTRDLAEDNNLKVGDAIILSDLRVGVPIEGRVRGIAYDTPNHQGDKIYYSVATAQKLAGSQPVINTAIVNSAQPKALTAALEASGWSVDWAAGRRDTQTANLWMIGLRGAGILGLLVSGIGIANTMQVLLRRRRGEIAIWKTLGYSTGHLRLIFTLEAGLLGLAGSLLGAGLGVLVSSGLLELFRRTSTLLYEWTFSPAPPLLGVAAGTLTTVIFAAWAIVVSSQARPAALLRNEPVDVQRLPGWQAAFLALLLAGGFTLLTGLVMESALEGIGVLAGIVIGIAVLGGFFSGALWVCVRAVPLGGLSMARLAFNNLRRRGAVLVFAMIALFIGVLSMSMGLEVLQLSELKIGGQPDVPQGYNLTVLAAAGQESAIRQALQAQQPEKVSLGYRTGLENLRAADGGAAGALDAVLVGRSEPGEYIVSGAAWGSQPDGVYAYQGADLKAGSQVEVTLRGGANKTLTVIGSYDIDYRGMGLHPPTGLLMTAEAFNRVATPDSLAFFVKVSPGRAGEAAAALGAALPQATVVDLAAYAARSMQSTRKLYVLPMAMAGLALLAGLLLAANSASLAVLDRRYEIGILKTVGYSRRQILTIFAVEYGLAGLLATAAGVALVQALLAALAFGNHMPASILLLNLPSVGFIALCGVGLTLLTVLGVTWTPTSVPPVVVLNERN